MVGCDTVVFVDSSIVLTMSMEENYIMSLAGCFCGNLGKLTSASFSSCIDFLLPAPKFGQLVHYSLLLVNKEFPILRHNNTQKGFIQACESGVSIWHMFALPAPFVWLPMCLHGPLKLKEKRSDPKIQSISTVVARDQDLKIHFLKGMDIHLLNLLMWTTGGGQGLSMFRSIHLGYLIHEDPPTVPFQADLGFSWWQRTRLGPACGESGGDWEVLLPRLVWRKGAPTVSAPRDVGLFENEHTTKMAFQWRKWW